MTEGPTWVLFGGSGFVGMHLAEHLLAELPASRVLLADIAPPRPDLRGEWYDRASADGRLQHITVDVREPIAAPELEGGAGVAVVLAAIHREPGHRMEEYFVTNVRGAEHVCEWARRTATRRVVFTSSIAVYGNTRDGVDERSLPMPETPYGISKLVAEQIFARWRAEDSSHRLAIVRPAVVFGPGEGGNVSRLVQAVARGRFVYVGNRDVRKAGGYVRDLCAAITWLVGRMDAHAETLANFASPQPPSLADYVGAIEQARAQRRPIPNLPYAAVYQASRLVSAVAGGRSPIHPRRVQKLVWATDVRPTYLVEQGFPFAYSLQEACADWRRRAPQEWA